MKDDNSATRHAGTLWTELLGADLALNEHLIVGAALLGNGMGLETHFNQARLSSHAFGIHPYAAYQINDYLSFTAMSGLGWNWGTSEHTNTGTQNITGRFSATRYFFSGSVDTNMPLGNFNLNAGTGLTWSQQFHNGYTESNGTQIGSMKVSSGIYHIQTLPSYLFKVDRNSQLYLEPYAIGRYDFEFTKDKITVGAGQIPHENAQHGFTTGAGINIYATESMSFSLEATHSFKENKSATTMSISGRFRF